MSRNIVPRVNRDADIGTPAKNWNTVYANRLITEIIALNGSDLQSTLNGKVDQSILASKGDLFVATDAGAITRFPRGNDGEILRTNSTTAEGLEWAPVGERTGLGSSLIVNVGTNGHYATINEALAALVALYYPVYLATGEVPQATINLLSGFVMAEQVLVEGVDLSWITITGVDAETMITRSALTRSLISRYPAFGVYRGTLPVIEQLFNMDASGVATNRDGVYCRFGCCQIGSGCGVKNAGGNGIYAYGGSTINANGANASGAMNYGIYAERASTINAEDADASGAGTDGIVAARGSTINANGANASGAGTNGIATYNGSIINAVNATGTLKQTANTVTSNGIIFQ